LRLLLEGGAIGGDGLFEPRGAALAPAKRLKRIAEIVLGRAPVERHPLAGPLLQGGAIGHDGLFEPRGAALAPAKRQKRIAETEAERAVKPGDLVTELDGTPVRDAADLQLRLALLRIGEVAEFAVSRPGGAVTVRSLPTFLRVSVPEAVNGVVKSPMYVPTRLCGARPSGS
jgi:hypothetical protein